MKKKSKKHLNSLGFSEDNILEKKTKKDYVEGNSTLKSSKFYSHSSSLNESTDRLAFEENAEKKKHKKSKRKKSELMESNEKTHYNCSSGEEEPPSRKKRKKEISMDADPYKPGMLSDLLQKKKYGCLILPWEASFGKDPSPNRSVSEGYGNDQRPKIKINPLFDLSKQNERSAGTVPENNTTYSVFVGNLPQEVTVNQVKKIFKKFGNTINKIKIRSEQGKKFKTFTNSKQNVGTNSKHALVKFGSLDSYEAALKMNGKLYNGHHLRITGAKGETSSDPEKSVFVGNLAIGMSDDELWKTFESCGSIDSVRVIRDKVNKKGYFGYINFKSAESVSEALQLDSTTVLDREIRVNRIIRNIDSLSNSITVKRKKKKRTKPQLNGNECTDIANAFGEIQGKAKKTSTKGTVDLEQDVEPVSPKKKKKKKKKSVAQAEENKTSDTE